MESLVFDAKLGNDVAVGVASTITGGVEIADDKFVPPGSVITTLGRSRCPSGKSWQRL